MSGFSKAGLERVRDLPNCRDFWTSAYAAIDD